MSSTNEGPSSPLSPRPDLGLRALLPAWRSALGRATLRDDALAGATAVGPSFALALLTAQHAGLPATAALVSAVLGSAVVALLGGTTLGLSGPGLATGFALVAIARDHGAAGLALAGAAAGAVQLALGALGVGRFARLVPLTAVHAFCFGLGVLLVIQSMPYVLGIATPIDLDALRLVDHLSVHALDARPWAVAVAAFACAAALLGARYARRVPVALLAVAASAGVVAAAGLDIPTLPDMPLALPEHPAPGLPDRDLTQFARSALVLFALATIETLLSVSAEEERMAGVRGDFDQELIGHGAANLLLSLVGGVAATGSIARSSALHAAGGRTRAAAIFHALLGAALVPLLLGTDRFIPLSALAGLVVALAVPLLDPRPLLAVLRVSRAEALVLVATVLIVVFGDLLNGVEACLAATLALAMLRIARFRAALHRGGGGAPHQVNLSGPLTFLSAPELDRLRARLEALDLSVGVILDVRSVLAMDLTGCERFVSLVAGVVERGGKAAVLGASPSCRLMLDAADRRGVLASRMAVTDRDVDAVLGRARAFEMRAQVVAHLRRFRDEVREHYTPLFDQLADGQHPHTLFITCVDSRVTPAMITGTHPGELFIVRCLGAMVTPPGHDALHAEGAAVEYAVGVLGVRNIVICGHSQCGAVKAVKTGHVPDELSNLRRWLAAIPAASGDLSGYHDLDDAARAVVVRQLDNLRKFPLVRAQLDRGHVELHAWFYDVGQAEVFEWDEAQKSFSVLGAGAPSLLPSAPFTPAPLAAAPPGLPAPPEPRTPPGFSSAPAPPAPPAPPTPPGPPAPAPLELPTLPVPFAPPAPPGSVALPEASGGQRKREPGEPA